MSIHVLHPCSHDWSGPSGASKARPRSFELRADATAGAVGRGHAVLTTDSSHPMGVAEGFQGALAPCPRKLQWDAGGPLLANIRKLSKFND